MSESVSIKELEVALQCPGDQSYKTISVLFMRLNKKVIRLSPGDQICQKKINKL